jgi:hypothetical protein
VVAIMRGGVQDKYMFYTFPALNEEDLLSLPFNLALSYSIVRPNENRRD